MGIISFLRLVALAVVMSFGLWYNLTYNWSRTVNFI
jgi:hypothetical protein